MCFRTLFSIVLIFTLRSTASAEDSATVIDLWEGMAPGESTRNPGVALPRRADENPPATRIAKITSPQLLRFDPPKDVKNGTSLVILPGGGYRYVVVDKEGSEIAEKLNPLGVTVFVLKYRTADQRTPDDWKRPVQDAQHAIQLLRKNADEWGLDPDRIGMMGFSAGGNAAAIAATNLKVFEPLIEGKDTEIARPNFLMLIYPWQLVGENQFELRPEVTVDEKTPPTFLVHAHNDRVTSMSSIAFYTALKQKNLPAELHIYESGGHGYGIRSVAGTNIQTWFDRAEDWMRGRKLVTE